MTTDYAAPDDALNADRFAELLDRMGAEPRRDIRGAGWSARCVHPDHHDDTPSLGFRDGTSGLIAHCYACAPRRGDSGRGAWFAQLLAAAREGTPLPPAEPSKRGTGGGTPTGERECEYVYRDADGTPLARKVRYRDPKTFRWERPYGDQWTSGLGMGGHPARLPLYRLPELLAAAGPVWVTEGEKDAERIAAEGETATCSPDSGAPPGDLSPLAGRVVRVVLDRDPAGVKSARRWVDALDGVAERVELYAPVPEAEKSDVSDHLDAGHTLGELIPCRFDGPRLVQTDDGAKLPGDTGDTGDTGRTGKRGPALRDRLVALAEERFDLGRDGNDRAYLVERAGPNVALLSGAAKKRLAAVAWEALGTTAGRTPLDEAWTTLEGLAQRVTPIRLPVRVAAHDGAAVLDLGTIDGAAVIATGDGWQVVDRSPVTFRRPKPLKALPVPVRGGTLDPLWQVVNVPPQARGIVRAWLACALLRDMPHPVVQIRGEQGAAKSTATGYLGALIDPCEVATLAPPRDAETWDVSATARWLLPIDNVSKIDPWWSDALCRTATGSGTMRRELYSNDDTVARHLHGCVILNGISLSSALRSDLAERLLPLDLARPAAYRTESELRELFTAAHPGILGAVLDDAAGILAHRDRVTPPPDLRMADFARALAAFDAATGERTLGAYRAMHDEAAAEALDADPLARCVLELLSPGQRWEGTAAQLLGALEPIRRGLADGRELDPGGWWPTDATRLVGGLTRSAPLLAREGVTWQRGQRTGKGRRITLARAADPAEEPPTGDASDAGDAGALYLAFSKEEGNTPPTAPPAPKHTSTGSSVTASPGVKPSVAGASLLGIAMETCELCSTPCVHSPCSSCRAVLPHDTGDELPGARGGRS